jgi:DNA-binding XRE family transcriptional regulator
MSNKKEKEEYEAYVNAVIADAEAAMKLDQEQGQIRADSLRHVRGAFLRSLIETRYKKNLSQTELAEQLGMQQSAIARIENGRGNPGLNTLLAIARALDVDLVLE